MKISRRGWVCHGRFADVSHLQCSYCHRHLQKWYEFLLNKLVKLLPNDYKPICCSCAFIQAYNILKCPKCGRRVHGDWWDELTDTDFSMIECMSCGWRMKFRSKRVEEKITEYLATLW